MMPDHLGIHSTDAKVAVITGNPDRISLIASVMDESRELGSRRGFLCRGAKTGGVPVLITATGIGAPSTAIVVEELIELGVTVILRLGTCGAIQRRIKPADLVIPTGCIREEGTSLQYIDRAFPAVPDPFALWSLVEAADRAGIPFHLGVTHCKDAYYSERPAKQPDPDGAARRWEVWRRAGALATEMEASALFILGALRGVRTGAVFVNVGSRQDQDALNRSLLRAMSLIQETIKSLSERDLIPLRPKAPADGAESFLELPGD